MLPATVHAVPTVVLQHLEGLERCSAGTSFPEMRCPEGSRFHDLTSVITQISVNLCEDTLVHVDPLNRWILLRCAQQRGVWHLPRLLTWSRWGQNNLLFCQFSARGPILNIL